MTLVDMAAGCMLLALVVYVLSGGADFGAGVWSLFARGRHKVAQEKLIADAIGPIWEANHVWLILLIVLMFTAFPRAFAALGTSLHLPLTLMLVGVVMRGSAFVFRHYGEGDGRSHRRWERIFAVASLFTPVLLGMMLGAASSGALELSTTGPAHLPVHGFVAPWTGLFPCLVGLLALTITVFLSAVYLARDAELQGNTVLSDVFRTRALIMALLLFVVATATALPVASPQPNPSSGRAEPLKRNCSRTPASDVSRVNWMSAVVPGSASANAASSSTASRRSSIWSSPKPARLATAAVAARSTTT